MSTGLPLREHLCDLASFVAMQQQRDLHLLDLSCGKTCKCIEKHKF